MEFTLDEKAAAERWVVELEKTGRHWNKWRWIGIALSTFFMFGSLFVSRWSAELRSTVGPPRRLASVTLDAKQVQRAIDDAVAIHALDNATRELGLFLDIVFGASVISFACFFCDRDRGKRSFLMARLIRERLEMIDPSEKATKPGASGYSSSAAGSASTLTLDYEGQ